MKEADKVTPSKGGGAALGFSDSFIPELHITQSCCLICQRRDNHVGTKAAGTRSDEVSEPAARQRLSKKARIAAKKAEKRARRGAASDEEDLQPGNRGKFFVAVLRLTGPLSPDHFDGRPFLWKIKGRWPVC